MGSSWSCGRMVVGLKTTCAISAYHHWSCGFESSTWLGVLDTALCNKVCQWLTTDRWYTPGTPVSFTNKTDRYDTTEISTRPNSTQQESNYIYLYTTKFGTSIKIRLNRKFESTEYETTRVNCTCYMINMTEKCRYILLVIW